MRTAVKIFFFMLLLQLVTGFVLLKNPTTGDYVINFVGIGHPQTPSITSETINATVGNPLAITFNFNPLDLFGLGHAISYITDYISPVVLGFYNFIVNILWWAPSEYAFIIQSLASLLQVVFYLLVAILLFEAFTGREILGMD
jgi:hypothetical protein